MNKQWYQSKTVWVNLLTAVVAVGTALSGTDFVVAHPTAVTAIGSVLAVVNILLRFVTDEAIK